MTAGPHVAINAEPLFTIGGMSITNSLLTSLIISTLIILFAITVRLKLKQTSRPKGLQNFAEWLVESLYNLTYSVAGNVKKSRLFFPLVATFFIFIILNNWFGLMPGVATIGLKQKDEVVKVKEVKETEIKEVTKVEEGKDIIAVAVEHETKPATEKEKVVQEHVVFKPLFRPGTSDINTTLALALVSVIATQIIGLKFLGLGYLKKFFNFSSPIMFFVGILELISELAKIISFSFRLFGNIFAGEVLLAVITFLVPILMPAPFYGMELFVGFIQALVFAMLTLVFLNMATEKH